VFLELGIGVSLSEKGDLSVATYLSIGSQTSVSYRRSLDLGVLGQRGSLLLLLFQQLLNCLSLCRAYRAWVACMLISHPQ
jgi:hypothetical protein